MNRNICKQDECPYFYDCEPWEDHENEPYPDCCPVKLERLLDILNIARNENSREKHGL